MKNREVICIIDDSSYLTKGKKYEVISESEMQCQVVDDELDLLTCPLEDFKPVKNKSKKAKKIKELRDFFNVSVASFDWCFYVVSEKGNVPQSLIKMQALHRIGLEEISKEKPSMKRIKFLASQMENLTEQTIKD